MAEKKRRVVQITGIEQTVAALCDDGSIWLLTIPYGDAGFKDRRWVRGPDIPQTKPTL